MTKGLPDPTFWKDRRVFLTGHTGFKGAWLSLWLAEMGARVTGLALVPGTQPNLFDLAGVAARVQSHIGDVRDGILVREITGKAAPRVIIHMAAQALVRRSYNEPADTFATNVVGTANVLDAARATNGLDACLVITSDKVYENDGTGTRFNESARLGGHDPYSASKAAAEIAVASYRDSFFGDQKAKPATARGGNVIGGGDFSDDRIVPDIWRAHQANQAVVLRYPNATRPWQHVLDCLCGYLVYAEYLSKGEFEPALNFGPMEEKGLAVRELVTAMQGAIGAREAWTEASGPQPKEMPALALSCEKAEQVLGWRSRLDARQAIDWTAEWYKAFAAGDDASRITLDQIKRYADT